MAQTGLIHIYYGDGKGKTTAAVGQAVRAAGYGYRVLVFQFLKNNTSSERKLLKQIEGITCMDGQFSEKFTFQMDEKEKQESRAYCRKMLKKIQEAAKDYDVLFLDEAVCAVNVGFLEEEELLSFLNEKPEHLEVILTGHMLPEKLKDAADYVTEMKKIKHPFDKGIVARKGIEQ